MVAKMMKVTNSDRAIRYNERKVENGSAICIYAGNFLQDVEALTIAEKRKRFNDLLALNHRTKCRAIHLILGFAPGEVLSKEVMIELAREFMESIGYGNQPYLVYQHFDTALAHLHIVANPIRPDGTSLSGAFSFRHNVEPVRLALEEKYGLIRIADKKAMSAHRPRPASAEKFQYGKLPTIPAITDILGYVLTDFRYRSLSDLNIILKWYNLQADPGRPGSPMHRNGGLCYHMLNDKGEIIGTPIKASLIYFKPGLKWLTAKFEANGEINAASISRTRSVLNSALTQQGGGWPGFVDVLRSEQISVSSPAGTELFPDDLDFVDWQGKTVLSTGDLGPDYSAKEIFRRLGLNPLQTGILLAELRQSQQEKKRHAKRL
jgi:Relaxase/Mobilisation nuclease domain